MQTVSRHGLQRRKSVFLNLDPTPFTDEDPIAESTVIGRIAADAISANAIPRTAFLSSLGAERRHGAGLIDGRARIEEQLDATGSGILHLRCGYFFTISPQTRAG
jgi:uncharacterized protein YbjT (DUF2867 family)